MELALYESNSKDVSTSLNSVFDEYDSKIMGLNRISEFVNGKDDLIHYFVTGNSSTGYMARELFDLNGAISAVNAEYWSKVMKLTNVLECMPAAKRNDWHQMIHDRKTPDFERETVIATVAELLGSRSSFFADKVADVFKHLSGNHVTNSSMAFKSKMILDYVVDKFGYIEYRRAEYVHDLRCVVAQLRDLNQPKNCLTMDALRNIVSEEQFGKWFEFDAGAFKVKLFKCGTAHIEIHPEMVFKLNRILASKYPQAVPEKARRGEKAVKIVPLKNNSISFEAAMVILDLANTKGDRGTRYMNVTDQKADVVKEVKAVVEFFGGKFDKNGKIVFPTWPTEALRLVARTCILPDAKTNQYYPTKSDLAEYMMDLADIQPGETVLEPSAGQGGLADHVSKDQITCVELCQANAAVLRGKGFEVVETDFLKYPDTHLFDKIVMNPPFSEGRAKDHLIKAFGHLNPNGTLVACLPASLKDKALIPGVYHEWSETFEDKFDGTSVRVVILKLLNLAN